jgi:hypothetical protein
VDLGPPGRPSLVSSLLGRLGGFTWCKCSWQVPYAYCALVRWTGQVAVGRESSARCT